MRVFFVIVFLFCTHSYAMHHNRAEQLLHTLQADPHWNNTLSIYMPFDRIHEIVQFELQLYDAAHARGLHVRAITIREPQVMRQYIFTAEKIS